MSEKALASEISGMAAAAQVLRSGGLVVFPTETVYGVGANAFDPVACAKIFAAKGRPRFNPLIVHISGIEQIEEVACPTPEALELARHFWPGPLTLVLPKKAAIDGIVTGDLDTVGVRVPAHPLARDLIKLAGVPVAAPSANRFMCLSPTTVEHARSQLGEAVDIYLDGGPCSIGLESTIVGWSSGKPVLLRPGGLDPRLIEAVVGPLHRAPEGKIIAPGMLARHYSPRARLFLADQADCPKPSSNVALLCISTTGVDTAGYASVVELAPDGNLTVAAARLYAALHALDKEHMQAIVACLAPEEGLGIAINDRLRRAAAAEK